MVRILKLNARLQGGGDWTVWVLKGDTFIDFTEQALATPTGQQPEKSGKTAELYNEPVTYKKEH
uniref:Phage protein n=1 Tax=Heterorhabditis bacteriophora TaxID=37862 RepID=A0A1I7XTU3_HETBA